MNIRGGYQNSHNRHRQQQYPPQLASRLAQIVVILALLNVQCTQARLFLPGVMNYFSCDTVHRVKLGDSCMSIANQHEIKLSLLLWKNKKLDCRNLLVGMRLCVDNWI